MFRLAPLTLASTPRRHCGKRLAVRAGVGIFLLCAVALAAAALCLLAAARAALPQLDGTRQLAGLSAPVTVRRDAHGVAAITAASLNDLFFAQGYVTAQDRLWQMDMSRRYAAGELAEVMGGDYLKLDLAQRVLGLRKVAEMAVSRLSARDRQYMESYARGVNAYISEHQRSLPLEFRGLRYWPRAWTPADSFLVGAMMSEMLNHYGYRDKLEREKIGARLGPELTADLFPTTSGRDILPDGERPLAPRLANPNGSEDGREADAHRRHHRRHLHLDPNPKPNPSAASGAALAADQAPEPVPGSNNWVLSGAHTASGKPLLSNDMHLPHRIPNTWYEIHLTSGEYDVAGVSLPGLPAVIAGHNRQIAWGFTNLGADVEDLYIESFNEQGEYLTPEGWRKPSVRHETIRVRGGRERALEVIETRHGPVITSALRLSPAFQDEARQLALRWTIYDPGGLSFPFFELNMARNWDEFRHALSQMGSPGQNIVYADVEGHIGYQASGLVPIRAAGDGLVPASGSDESHDWKGYIPFEEMPRMLDPPSGILATANQRVTADDYPYTIANDWGSPYRAERIHRVLRQEKKFTAADMLALENDVYSDVDRFFAERFVYAVDSWAKASPRARQAAELLRQWDGQMKAGSAAAAIERHARRNLQQSLLEAKLGAEAGQYGWFNSGVWLENAVLNQLPRWLPAQYGSYEEALAAAVEKTVGDSHAPGNLAAWRYGDDFPVEIEHPIYGKVPWLKRWAGSERRPQSGSGDTVKQVGRGFGPSERLTVDLANFDSTTLNIVNGQSGNLFSPYFKDQWEAWYTGATFALAYTAERVEHSAAHRLLLEPQR
jgi:penicillin amidase